MLQGAKMGDPARRGYAREFQVTGRFYAVIVSVKAVLHCGTIWRVWRSWTTLGSLPRLEWRP